MSEQEDIRPRVARAAAAALGKLSVAEREGLLVRGWMSHDARWFMAAVREYGMETANRLNKIAAHELGKVEAKRVFRAMGLEPVASVDDVVTVQETLVTLFAPDVVDYRVTKVGDRSYQMQMLRCFAQDNAVRAGIDTEYECGIFSRITGWLEALGLTYTLSPALGRCLEHQGGKCEYTITIEDFPETKQW